MAFFADTNLYEKYTYKVECQSSLFIIFLFLLHFNAAKTRVEYILILLVKFNSFSESYYCVMPREIFLYTKYRSSKEVLFGSSNELKISNIN